MSENMSIGAFSKRCGISISALRFYDQCALLVPAGVDPITGYRSYVEGQLTDAELLRDLRRIDMSIEQIRRFHRASMTERDALLAEQVEGFDARLSEVKATARALRTRIHNEGETVPGMHIDANALAAALDQVLPASSSEPKDAALQTVLVEARDGSLRLVATDRHRLVVRDLQPHLPADGVFRALIHASEAAALRASLPATGLASVEHLGTKLVIRTDQGDHDLALADGAFPPYEAIFSAQPEGPQLLALRSDVLAALQPILESDFVELSLSADGLTIDGAEGVTVPAQYDGEPISLAIRPSYMHEAVLHSIGPEVAIDVTSPVSPVVFRSADDGSYTCMVMPVRVGDPQAGAARKARATT